MSESLEKVLSLVRKIRFHASHGEHSPHKFIFLLALAGLYEADPSRPNEFPLNDDLEQAFGGAWASVLNEEPRLNAIEYPFYYLSADGFWMLKAKDDRRQAFELYKDSPNRRLTKARLIDTVDYGYLSQDFHDCLGDAPSRRAIIEAILDLLGKGEKTNTASNILEHVSFEGGPGDYANPFVGYLNTLHCRDSGGENALAEAQACNSLFSQIQVRNPIVDTIGDCLRGVEPRHVILTGHAGDGKSTIALELYKEFCGLPLDQPLEEPMSRRQDITLAEGRLVSIVKDLSEWGDDDRLALLGETLSGGRRFLLVSNTGTLLNLFCEYGDRHLDKSKTETESALLEAIGYERRYDLNFGGGHFAVFNLALLDNLSTARRILDRMLAAENWSACAGSDCQEHCPIHRNVSLMGEHQDPVLNRLFLAYRRMYEYGTRLTLRQLTAHLAYILTSGLECAGISALSQRLDRPLMSEFMFYNRFFGDSGVSKDILALQLRAVKEIHKQGFGERPCPTWERRLWLLTRNDSLPLGIPVLEDEFDKLRHYGSGEWKAEDLDLSADQAREQVRRMLYFLYAFPAHDEPFIRQFLGSPAILKWWSWQSGSSRLSLDEAAVFKQRVFHVLQEQFTGVRLPESAGGDQRLYITLNRHKQDIRQSAQVVVAQVDFGSEFSLELTDIKDEWGGIRRDLCLSGRGRLAGIRLSLTLPFLDYMLMRHGGEAAEAMQFSYVARLERLKAQLLELGEKTRGDDVLLVRLRTNHTFVRQVYAVHGDRLEVANA